MLHMQNTLYTFIHISINIKIFNSASYFKAFIVKRKQINWN